MIILQSLLLLRALIGCIKDTDDGRVLQLHQCEVASLMNLVTTDTGVDKTMLEYLHLWWKEGGERKLF